MRSVAKNVSCPTCPFLAQFKQGDALPCCFSSHIAKKCHFRVRVVPCFSIFLFLSLLLILLFKTAPRHDAEVLGSVPKCQKARICLMEKIHVLDQLQQV